VERERLPIPDDLRQLRTDLVPLYDVPLEECHRMIIELANLLAVANHHIEATSNAPLAQTILEEAASILDNFDDDVAEFMRTLLVSQSLTTEDEHEVPF
jgi:hypothetical protein